MHDTEQQEEKVSSDSRRLEDDLINFERNFISQAEYWESVTIHARYYLIMLSCLHAMTLYRILFGFYYAYSDLTYILPALTTSAMLAWFIHAGRCGHLNASAHYQATRIRALARLSLTFEKKNMIRTEDWFAEVTTAHTENSNITAMLQHQDK